MTGLVAACSPAQGSTRPLSSATRSWASTPPAASSAPALPVGQDDIKRVVELLEERDLQFEGEHVALVVGMFDGKVSVTNTVQIRIEQKPPTSLTKAPATDPAPSPSSSYARPSSQRIDFTAEQRTAIHALGQGGGLTLLTGVAGAGKTTLLQPVVDAWRADTRFSRKGRR